MKKFRLLCSLLSALMVFSGLTAIPAGAAKLDSTTLFCDFETFAEGSVTSSALKAEGLTGYNTSMGESSSTAKIIEEADGNKAVGISTTTGHLYVAAPSVITTGKAYIGFSLKGDSYQYIKAFFEAPRSADSTAGISRYIGEYVATVEGGVAPANSSSGTLIANPASRDASKWCNVKITVDLDNNTWTTYLEGKDLGTFEFSKDVTEFYGFSFYEGYLSGSGMVDNISIICDPTGKDAGVKLFSSTTEADGDGNAVITAAFSEALDVDAEDIKVTKCGSDEEITVADVTLAGTKLTITLDGSPDVGCEYVVTFDGYEDIEIYMYIESYEKETMGYYKIDFEGEYATETYDGKTYVNDEQINKIISSTLKVNNTLNTLTIGDILNTSDKNGTDVSGKVLCSNSAGTYFYLLDVIETDVGVETYEFDYKWHRGGYHGKNFLMMSGDDTVNGATEKTILQMPEEDTWHHIKIEYDTESDTITVYKDGAVDGSFTNVPKFENKLYLYTKTQSGAAVLQIDNYEQYVTTIPLNVEKVRYIGADGKNTGTNNISPEIAQIDITFSGAINDTTLGGITLTADGKPVDFDEPVVNGKIVTLPIPGMLPGDADIELIVPSGVAALDGQLLPDDRIYNVSTKKGKFEISGLSLELNYDTVTTGGTTGAEGDTVVITADVINTASMGKTLSLIYAFYNDSELVDIGFEDVIVKSDEYVTSIETKALTTKANVEYDTVKAFVWNGLDKAASQTFAVSYPSE